MTPDGLIGARIMVVEDEYYIADDVRSVLQGLGATVLGPVPSASKARALIENTPAIDYVLLDINLGGEMAFDVADALQTRGIPFAFVTGYDRAAVPDRFSEAIRLEKPVRAEQLTALLQASAATYSPSQPA